MINEAILYQIGIQMKRCGIVACIILLGWTTVDYKISHSRLEKHGLKFGDKICQIKRYLLPIGSLVRAHPLRLANRAPDIFYMLSSQVKCLRITAFCSPLLITKINE